MENSPRAFWGILGALMLGASSLQAIDLPLRINSGGPAIGKKGTEGHWVSDKDFVEGGESFTFSGEHDTSQVDDPAPAEVYQTVRHRDHDYTIKGLPPGLYRVRFHFTDLSTKRKRSMDFRIHGQLVINNFNPVKAAGGTRRVHIIDVVTKIEKRQPLVIQCRADKGDDVFESGLEILPYVEPSIASGSGQPDPVAIQRAEAIRQFAGAPARFVWSQSYRGQHSVGIKDNVRLMGLDTEDGVGERLLLPDMAGYAKPMLTPDGQAVVYSDRQTRRVYRVNWDGTGRTDLGTGFATDVWRDPGTGRDWVYLRKDRGERTDAIVRRPLDGRDEEQPVWDHTENGHNVVPWFQLSADGRRFADAFPWPRCGTGNLASDDWEQLASGCWPGMAPDNSYRSFVFSGSHTDITLFDGDGERSHKISFANVPGAKGRKVYFPRWSNDVRFLTISSPEKDPKAELYLGKFDAKWEKIESWVRVTHNSRADIFGDAWIRPDKTPAPGAVVASTAPQRATPAADTPKAEPWPGSQAGLLWIWDHAQAKNEIPPLPGGKRPLACSGELQGRARFGPWHELRLGAGSFIADSQAGPRIAAALAKSRAFSFEALIGRESSAGGNGTVFSLHQPGQPPLLALTQEGDSLRLDFAPKAGAEPVKVALAPFTPEPGKTVHILLGCDQGKARLWIDGRESGKPVEISPDFSAWDTASLALSFGGGGWPGHLERIVFRDRAPTPDEARRQAVLAIQPLAGRTAPPRLEIEARLVEATEAPEMEDLGTYRRALVENVYEITAVKSGEGFKVGDSVAVLQWVIMDGSPLASADRLKEDHAATLVIEPAEAHPELEGEFRSSDHAAFDAPVYFDVRSHEP